MFTPDEWEKITNAAVAYYMSRPPPPPSSWAVRQWEALRYWLCLHFCGCED
jgi:hypothetical protein